MAALFSVSERFWATYVTGDLVDVVTVYHLGSDAHGDHGASVGEVLLLVTQLHGTKGDTQYLEHVANFTAKRTNKSNRFEKKCMNENRDSHDGISLVASINTK